MDGMTLDMLRVRLRTSQAHRKSQPLNYRERKSDRGRDCRRICTVTLLRIGLEVICYVSTACDKTNDVLVDEKLSAGHWTLNGSAWPQTLLSKEET